METYISVSLFNIIDWGRVGFFSYLISFLLDSHGLWDLEAHGVANEQLLL